MRGSTRIMAGLLGASLLMGGCYGPFNLTRRVYRWNGQVSQDRWIVEVVFLVCTWVPIYGLATLGDALIFNSIEFWGGRNPVEPPSVMNSQTPPMRRVARGNMELLLQRMGSQLQVEQLQDGQSVGRLLLERRGELLVASDPDGRTVFTAHTLPDGSVVVHDAGDQQVAYYTGQQVEQLLSSVRQ